MSFVPKNLQVKIVLSCIADAKKENDAEFPQL
jgi:hypothetical protein